MLTEETSRERKWGQYPTLRKALEDKRIPDRYYGPTSVSDNMFAELHRLVEIAILAREYESIIKATAHAIGPEAVSRDLDRLYHELNGASSFFREQAEYVEALRRKIY
jgi:hypothetical protein